jgi:hypothetical protein
VFTAHQTHWGKTGELENKSKESTHTEAQRKKGIKSTEVSGRDTRARGQSPHTGRSSPGRRESEAVTVLKKAMDTVIFQN